MAACFVDIFAQHSTSAEQADRMSGATLTVGASTVSGKVRVTWDDALPNDKLIRCVKAIRQELENRGVDRLAFVQG
jgi:hypothetical protein